MKPDYQQAIALVDDDKDIINPICILFKRKGYNVFGFTDPILLLDYIGHHDNQFRLILIDYKMPNITGCELANKIADINPRTEMVLITAVNDIINNKLKLEHIHKRLRLSQLLQIVTKFMN